MSRSALYRTEANRQGRDRQADEAFLEAIEAGRNNRIKGLVPLHGSDETFNLNPVLLQAITKSSYFQNKCLRDLQDWTSLVDEIYYECKHLEPFTRGAAKTPSTAFCLLLRLFTLRCSEKQMKLMLDHVDSPYIRCIGFLYLRYACQPALLWDWFEPYLYDDEPVKVQSNRPEVTVGQFVRSLLQEMNYHGTLLPRLPVAIERDIKVKLLQAQQIEDRAVQHYKNSRAMDYFTKLGSKVRALYGDEENPVTWYDAVVDRVITVDPETREPLSRPKFVVTFPEYGNTETVTLGELDMPGGSGVVSSSGRGGRGRYNNDNRRGYDDRRGGYDQRGDGGSRGYDRGYDRGHHRRDDRWDRDGGGRKRSRSRERNDDVRPSSERDLMEEVRRQEREKILSQGKSYSSRPPSAKASLASSGGGGRVPRDDDRRSNRHPPQQQGPLPGEEEKKPAAVPPKKKSPEELAAIQEKKRKLMAKYG